MGTIRVRDGVDVRGSSRLGPPYDPCSRRVLFGLCFSGLGVRVRVTARLMVTVIVTVTAIQVKILCQSHSYRQSYRHSA